MNAAEKKRKNRFKMRMIKVGVIFGILILVVGLGVLGWSIISKNFGGSTRNDINTDIVIVDMSDPNGNTDYGKIYYSPIDENHIVEEDSIRYIDNEVLVVAQDGVTREQVLQLANDYNAEIVGEIEITGDYQLRINNSSTKNELEDTIQRMQNEDIIETASLNYVAEMSDSKQTEDCDGFYYGKQWQGDLQNFNDAKGKSWGLEAISTTGAWDKLTHTSRKINPVKIGLIDVGFDVNHEDLQFAEVFYDNGANGLTAGEVAHGTHVAGTMAASNNDITGICGIYPYGAGRLYGVSNCSDDKGNAQGVMQYNHSLMAEKIAFAELIVRNVKVINTSRGFSWNKKQDFEKWYDKTSTDSHFDGFNVCADFLGDFFQKLLDKGYDFVIVSSAGNNSRGLPTKFDASYSSYLNGISQTKYPDVYDRIIVVGAVDYNMNVAPYSDGGNRVDIYAPGGEKAQGNKEIYSTLANSKYGYMHGTSMAAPHVAGVAAMVWSANNSLTGAEVKDAITRRSSLRCTSCHMVDAYMAVSYALGEEDSGDNSNVENGGVLCYVVERFHEDNKIANANVILKNVDTDDTYTTTTDDLGHFEIMLPEGNYSLTVTADGFEDYEWPDGNNYQNPIVVRNEGINYLDDWVKMTRKPGNTDATTAVQPTTEVPTEPTQPSAVPEENEINTDEDEFYEYLEDDYEDYDYGVPLEDMIAWTYHNGHLYALFDYAVSAKIMNLVTLADPSVHLVTIANANEQSAVEELIAVGGRNIYYTGGLVDENGQLYWINGESANYSNWYTGCPDSYDEEGYDDIVVIYRGAESPAENDSDFGVWLEVLEDDYSYLDIFDLDLEGITRGIIIEWDDPGSYGLNQN